MTYFLSPCNIIYNFNEMLLHIKTYFFPIAVCSKNSFLDFSPKYNPQIISQTDRWSMLYFIF